MMEELASSHEMEQRSLAFQPVAWKLCERSERRGEERRGKGT